MNASSVLLALLLSGCGLLLPKEPDEAESTGSELTEGQGTLVLRRGQAHVLVALADGRTERHRLAVGAAKLTTADAGRLADLTGLVEIALGSWSNQPDLAEGRGPDGSPAEPVLDERIREIFFETARVPAAHVQVLEI